MPSPGPGRLGAVACAMVTPFDDEERLDLDGAAELARWLEGAGVDALVVAGTTGESPTLSDAEVTDLWRAVVDAVDVPVVAGTSGPDTAVAVALTKAAAGVGVDGILAVTPYYNRPSQAGIDAHMRAVKDAAGELPVWLYDIPVRAGRQLAHATTARLAADGVVVGVKDATGDPGGAAALMAEVPDDFELISGNDRDLLPLLAVGACGVISVEANWNPQPLADICARFWKGDLTGALEANRGALSSHAFQSSDEWPNPLPAKAVLRAMGLPAGQCRLPMGSAPDALDRAAAALVAELEISRG